MNITKKRKFVKQSTVNSENMTGAERNYSENVCAHVCVCACVCERLTLKSAERHVHVCSLKKNPKNVLIKLFVCFKVNKSVGNLWFVRSVCYP